MLKLKQTKKQTRMLNSKLKLRNNSKNSKKSRSQKKMSKMTCRQL